MFRINTFEIRLPTLRERPDDIPTLAVHLLKRVRPAFTDAGPAFTEDAIEVMQTHTWPGNVRELANVVEHANILCDTLPIDTEHFPLRFGERPLRVKDFRSLGPITLRELEQHAIHAALQRHGGSKPKAAQELGVSLKTLYNKLNQAELLEKSA